MKFSVADLRRNGSKVRVSHKRPFFTPNGEELLSRHEAEDLGYWNEQHGPFQTGGVTTVEITTPTGETLVGEAKCSDDQGFYKQLGIYIAVGRALGYHPTEKDFVTEKKAQSIVNDILFDLHSRSRVGNALDEVCQDVYNEMERDLIELVKTKLS